MTGDESDYRDRLSRVLDEHLGVATARLGTIVGAWPEAAVELDVVVFPGQESDGALDVWAHLVGPDHFALNRPFDGVRELFGVVYGEAGLEPEVPDPPAGIDVDAVIVDTAADWVERVWRAAGGPGSGIVLRIDGEHGAGRTVPRLIGDPRES
ncbi:MAG: DUF6389 family protein [Protaetiibacter sp.]